MKSVLYKLVENNVIVAEGSASSMRKLKKKAVKEGRNVFVGIGAPFSTLGKVWASK